MHRHIFHYFDLPGLQFALIKMRKKINTSSQFDQIKEEGDQHFTSYLILSFWIFESSRKILRGFTDGASNEIKKNTLSIKKKSVCYVIGLLFLWFKIACSSQLFLGKETCVMCCLYCRRSNCIEKRKTFKCRFRNNQNTIYLIFFCLE